ncbi:MAG: hypothetical protein KAG80_02055 [Nocardioides sp.]|nr:hypothetical protein [Nocardioides sp.]
MSNLRDDITSAWDILLGLSVLAVALAFLTPFVTRLIVQLYPTGHDRREEFVEEARHVPTWRRPTWLAGILSTTIIEATPWRAHGIRRDATILRWRSSGSSTRRALPLWVAQSALAVVITGGSLVFVAAAIRADAGATVFAWLLAVGSAFLIAPGLAVAWSFVRSVARHLAALLSSWRERERNRRLIVEELLRSTSDGRR